MLVSKCMLWGYEACFQQYFRVGLLYLLVFMMSLRKFKMITSLAGKPVSGESATSSEDTVTGESEVQSLRCIIAYH